MKMPYNVTTGKEYNGKNIDILLNIQAKKDYSSSAWLTFKQAMDTGRSIKKGSKGTQILKIVTFMGKDADGKETATRKAPRGYTVFNLDQTELREKV